MVLFCRWRQFKLAIAVVDASADFLAATKRMAFVSVFYFVVSLLFAAFCVISAGFMLTMYGTTIDTTFGFQFRDPVIKKDNGIYLAVLLFGFLWILSFIQNKSNYICMVSAASFYFSSSREMEGSSQVKTGFKWAYLKNTGSLALGSLIHTFVAFLRFLSETASNSASNTNQNAVSACCSACCLCCLRCVEDAL